MGLYIVKTMLLIASQSTLHIAEGRLLFYLFKNEKILGLLALFKLLAIECTLHSNHKDNSNTWIFSREGGSLQCDLLFATYPWAKPHAGSPPDADTDIDTDSLLLLSNS